MSAKTNTLEPSPRSDRAAFRSLWFNSTGEMINGLAVPWFISAEIEREHAALKAALETLLTVNDGICGARNSEEARARHEARQALAAAKGEK